MSRATRNLSEKLLDLVEQDPRFIGLSGSAILAWVKIIRLLDRNATLRRRHWVESTSWDEMRLHLHVSSDRLLTLTDIFHQRDLLTHRGGFWIVPLDLMPVLNSTPHMKRFLEAGRADEERFLQSEEGQRALAAERDGEA